MKGRKRDCASEKILLDTKTKILELGSGILDSETVTKYFQESDFTLNLSENSDINMIAYETYSDIINKNQIEGSTIYGIYKLHDINRSVILGKLIYHNIRGSVTYDIDHFLCSNMYDNDNLPVKVIRSTLKNGDIKSFVSMHGLKCINFESVNNEFLSTSTNSDSEFGMTSTRSFIEYEAQYFKMENDETAELYYTLKGW